MNKIIRNQKTFLQNIKINNSHQSIKMKKWIKIDKYYRRMSNNKIKTRTFNKSNPTKVNIIKIYNQNNFLKILQRMI